MNNNKSKATIFADGLNLSLVPDKMFEKYFEASYVIF